MYSIGLAKDEIRIVQAALLGSILANLLLILGMAFLFGGLRFQEQVRCLGSWFLLKLTLHIRFITTRSRK